MCHLKRLNLSVNQHCIIFTFSAPFKTYTNGSTYLVRRQQDPSDSANARLYEDKPTRPCGHFGPFYRQCPVCLKNIPTSEIIPLHIIRHCIHYTCPPCLDFLLSRQYTKCPVCQQPHLYFRLAASLIPPSIIAQATPPSLPPPHRPQPRRNNRPRRNIRQLSTEE